ncbi:MGMT family protein [Bacteroides helcogenes]|uniref:O(6)-alkylguanine repair protein YbaZ n=1 Tax=Bacteroides helcogenes (strain ATCC 35417 / DSM 20613 / JCM 6297 / CCUG 15421 / P 36-108) TaxID=693979 RepID=E6SWP7_BACT6|nr:methylated-DNA--[protein]-cysteine S-methyltransferase [Bacteroides helcogenes]ADV43599.1 O(6)-alkylguanine repair protein YbaZ [Bacteroides helcogenes P 36-108]MDY5239321.1 methylated-DNA--[protein]-cysteine S-methyltransferase [Bacteroides helcogenes]
MDNILFRQEVYSVVAAVPSGRVVTYGQIAYLVGRPQCSRMVGHVMHNVPAELHLPCHRVVNSQGRLVPFWKEQRRLLEDEGVKFRKNGCVDMKVFQWEFMKE